MKQLEDNLQAACVEWFRFQYPNITIFSIPNGGSRNKIEAAKLKRTGVLAGVADLFVMRHKEFPDKTFPDRYVHFWHGLFIEMKVGKNKQTDAQIYFAVNAMAHSYQYRVCRSIEEFMNVVNEYLND